MPGQAVSRVARDQRFDVLVPVEARIERTPAGCALALRRCVCRAGGGARCTNGLRGQGTVRTD